MSEEEQNLSYQEKLYKVLSSEVRLRLLIKATEKNAISAPELAKTGDFDITPESIVNNLNQLENVGLLKSKNVRGPGNRPRKEFYIPEDGKELRFELVPDDYLFSFEDSDVAKL